MKSVRRKERGGGAWKAHGSRNSIQVSLPSAGPQKVKPSRWTKKVLLQHRARSSWSTFSCLLHDHWEIHIYTYLLMQCYSIWMRYIGSIVFAMLGRCIVVLLCHLLYLAEKKRKRKAVILAYWMTAMGKGREGGRKRRVINQKGDELGWAKYLPALDPSHRRKTRPSVWTKGLHKWEFKLH